MTRRTSLPRYCRQTGKKGSDRAFVKLGGRRIYLGRYGTAESREAFDRAVSEWLGNSRTTRRQVEFQGLTIVELLARWDTHADVYYRKPDGTPTTERKSFAAPLSILRKLYGRTAIRDFDCRALKACREKMIRRDWSRNTVNGAIRRIKGVFSWGVSEGLVPADVLVALRTLKGLAPGRSEARETDPVRPVSIDVVEATLPHLPDTVADMVRVQLLTGMRSGELLTMRPNRLDMSGDVWLYRPKTHKTAHHGRERIISIGPRAAAILGKYITGRPIDKPCFSPRESEEQRRAEATEARETPLSCGNTVGSNRVSKPEKKAGDAYTPTTYARAVRRGCEAAGIVPHWFPHQLRHTAATLIRKAAGLEVARAALGHSTMSVTEKFYAEADVAKVRDIMLRIG